MSSFRWPTSGGSGGGSFPNPADENLDMNGFDIENIHNLSGIVVIVPPSGGDDTTAIQDAVTEVSAAGGGLVKLLASEYTLSDEIVWPTDANGVVLQGSGPGTLISSELTGNTYPFNLTAAQFTALISNPARGDSSVTCSTASQASNYPAGTRVLIKGVDADGYDRQVRAIVLTAGNSGTGVIGLNSDIPFDMTSSEITAFPYGYANGVCDLSVRHTAGASHVVRFDFQWGSFLRNLYLDGLNYSGAYSLHITRSVNVFFDNIQNLNYNVVELDPGPVAAKGMEFAKICGLRARDLYLYNNGNASINSGALTLTGIEDAVFYDLVIDSSNYHGLTISAATTNNNIRFINPIITNSAQQGFVSVSDGLYNATIVAPVFAWNGQSDLQLQAERVTIMGGLIENNQDSGSDETVILQGCTDVIFQGTSITGNKSAMAITTSSTGVVLDGCSISANATNSIGVYFASSDSLTISDCDLRGNKWALYSGNNNTGVRITGNDLRDSTTNALILAAADTNFIITGNDASGQTVTYAGTGHIIANNLGINPQVQDFTTSGSTSGSFLNTVSDTSAPRTITISTADMIEGKEMVIKDISGGAGTNNITVDTQGSETIDGAASVTISVNYGVLKLFSDGTNWFTL